MRSATKSAEFASAAEPQPSQGLSVDGKGGRFTITVFLSLLGAMLISSCVTYFGVAKVGDQVYLTGAETFLIFSHSWVKQCTELEGKLYCKELPVVTPPRTPTAAQQTAHAPAIQYPLEAKPPETPPETQTLPPTPPYPLPEGITCQNAAALLCTCNSNNLTTHDLVCQRARQAVSDFHNNETMCLNLVRPMFPLAGCLPP